MGVLCCEDADEVPGRNPTPSRCPRKFCLLAISFTLFRYLRLFCRRKLSSA